VQTALFSYCIIIYFVKNNLDIRRIVD
jgi:hypothetical protein